MPNRDMDIEIEPKLNGYPISLEIEVNVEFTVSDHYPATLLTPEEPSEVEIQSITYLGDNILPHLEDETVEALAQELNETLEGGGGEEEEWIRT